MSTVKLGEKAKSVLQSFSKLNPTLRVRADYLYVKTNSINGVFNLSAGEIETDAPFVVFSMPDFLNVLGMFNTPTIDKNGLVLSVSDDGKKAVYLATDDTMVPDRQMGGEQLFDAHAANVTFACMLDEKSIKDITNAMSVIDADRISIVCKDAAVMAKVENRASENYVEIKLNGMSNTDITLDFGDKAILSSLFSGIYGVQCRACQHNGGELYLAKFVSQSIQAADGNLFYFAPMSII